MPTTKISQSYLSKSFILITVLVFTPSIILKAHTHTPHTQMEGGEEEKMDTNTEENQLLDNSSKPRKGGLRTMPFIIVNESFERVASYGLMPNMVFYLMNGYGMDAVGASNVLYVWSAASNGLAIVGAFLSDSYLGRFKVIALGSIASLLGMIVLWLTAMIPQLQPSQSNSATAAQLALLFSSFGLMSIGAGCIRPCSIAFGADQLANKENPNNERVLESFFNWYYASTGVSTVLALTVIVYIQENLGWAVGFGVPAILMVFSAVMFYLGSSLYIKAKVGESLLAGFVQVSVVAFKKRNISLPLPGNDDGFYHRNRESKIAPTENLRWLNKACVIQDPESELNPDGSASNPWTLCTVEQVESLKALLRIIPMWSTGIMLLVALSQGSFTMLQITTMDRHFLGFEIPAGSFNVFMIVTLTLWIAFYDRVLVPILSRHTRQARGLSPKVRMGIGLILSCVAMSVTAIVETIRRAKAIEDGFEDDPNAVVDMSAMWMVPQYALLGLAEAFNAIGQIEFFYTQFPKTMASIGVAIYTMGLAVASLLGSLLVNIVDDVTGKGGNISWLASNINKGHLEYYFGLVTFLCVVNFVYYLICCLYYDRSENRTTRLSRAVEEEAEYTPLTSAS
ncbi:unnamed protein product [Ilex paraguariensis]|uniref:Uncharacterized protein n=1 Tax=Ilex paraguariensis TaxID=185542 RepID=A0ABC8T9K7_9AQUA